MSSNFRRAFWRLMDLSVSYRVSEIVSYRYSLVVLSKVLSYLLIGLNGRRARWTSNRGARRPVAVSDRRLIEAGQRALTSAEEETELAATMVTRRSLASEVQRRRRQLEFCQPETRFSMKHGGSSSPRRCYHSAARSSTSLRSVRLLDAVPGERSQSFIAT